jgi:predicted ATP-grasp superfamily ATP-dependent carboligase
VEKGSVPDNALMSHGLPDVGLIGLIATSHIIAFATEEGLSNKG